jgi:hypothetical protein
MGREITALMEFNKQNYAARAAAAAHIIFTLIAHQIKNLH